MSDASSTTLACVDHGQGSVVLLVHGFPLDHRMWQAQIDALSRTHRVIAPDLAGFGDSALPDGKLMMETYAVGLARLLKEKQIDKPVHLAGFSMGGYVAFAFARQYANQVASLMLVDTKAAADTAEAAKGRGELAKKVLDQGPQVVADAMIPKLLAEKTRQENPQLVAQVRQMMLDQSPQAIAAALEAMAGRQDSTPDLAHLTIPTLLIVGQEDAITPPAEMQKVTDAIKKANAYLVTIAGAGHLTTMEKPEKVTAAMTNFLAGK